MRFFGKIRRPRQLLATCQLLRHSQVGDEMILRHVGLQDRWLFAFAAEDSCDSHRHAPSVFGDVQLVAWPDAIFLGKRFVNQRRVLIALGQVPALLQLIEPTGELAEQITLCGTCNFCFASDPSIQLHAATRHVDQLLAWQFCGSFCLEIVCFDLVQALHPPRDVHRHFARWLLAGDAKAGADVPLDRLLQLRHRLLHRQRADEQRENQRHDQGDGQAATPPPRHSRPGSFDNRHHSPLVHFS